MLQQTQVETVIPYYERFLERFPSIAALAQARLEEVLHLWQGLGYYRRAIHLWEGARQIQENWGGKLPPNLAQLQEIPGIGRYTAAAILSIGFGKPAAVLEANSRRVLTRLFIRELPENNTARENRLWAVAERLVPATDPGAFNQALMDLGSLVCLVRIPRCSDCPVRGYCDAWNLGAVPQVRPRSRLSAVERRQEVAAAVMAGNRVLLWQYGPHQRWTLLWDFPRFTIDGSCAGTEVAEKAVYALLRQRVGNWVVAGSFSYGVTRYRVRVECLIGRLRSRRLGGRQKEQRSGDLVDLLPIRPSKEYRFPACQMAWVSWESIESLPLTSPARRMLHLLRNSAGKFQENRASGTTG
jgi:A/G-specific adenine glycosylase